MIKVVKVHPARGHGTGMFKVVRVDHRHYVLKPIDGGVQFLVYSAHTYEDLECKQKSRELTEQQANSIGRKKR